MCDLYARHLAQDMGLNAKAAVFLATDLRNQVEKRRARAAAGELKTSALPPPDRLLRAELSQGPRLMTETQAQQYLLVQKKRQEAYQAEQRAASGRASPELESALRGMEGLDGAEVCTPSTEGHTADILPHGQSAI
jgi:hypothetical protein